MSKYEHVSSRYMTITRSSSISGPSSSSRTSSRSGSNTLTTPTKLRSRGSIPNFTSPLSNRIISKTPDSKKRLNRTNTSTTISNSQSLTGSFHGVNLSTPTKRPIDVDRESPHDLSGKVTGDLLATFKHLFPKGEVKCLCTVGNYIWTAGTYGQIGIYVNNNAYEHIEMRTIGKSTEAFSVLTTVAVGNEQDVQTIDHKIWSGFTSGKIAVWNFETMKKEHEIVAHASSVTSILQAGSCVWTASMDGTVRIWDSQTLQPLHKLTEHKGPVRSMVLVESEKQVWTAGDDGCILVRDATDGRVMQELEVGSRIMCLCVTTFKQVWSSDDEGRLLVWNATNGTCIKDIKAHESECCSLIATTKQVWSSGSDKLIRIYDSESLRELKKIRANSVWVTCMHPLSNQRILAVCSDKKIRVWKSEGEQYNPRLPVISAVERLTSIPYSPRTRSHKRLKSIDATLMRSITVEGDTFDLLNGAVDFPDGDALTSGIDIPQITRIQNEVSLASPMVSPILSVHQQALRNKNAALAGTVLDFGSAKKNSHMFSPGLSVPHVMEDLYDSSDDDDDTDYEDDTTNALREAFEKEIVVLRQQLQEATTRIGKYRSKLRHRRVKLHEKDSENRGISMKYNIMQDELYSLRGENAVLLQQIQDRETKLLQMTEERKGVAAKLAALCSKIIGTPPSPDVEKKQDAQIVRMIDKLILKVEMELQLNKFQQIHKVSSTESNDIALKDELNKTKLENEALKKKLSQLKTEIDSSFCDISSLIQNVKAAQKRNEQLNMRLEEMEKENVALKQAILSDSDDEKIRKLMESITVYNRKMTVVQSELEKIREDRNRLQHENDLLRHELSHSLHSTFNSSFNISDSRGLGEILAENEESIQHVLQGINNLKDSIDMKQKNPPIIDVPEDEGEELMIDTHPSCDEESPETTNDTPVPIADEDKNHLDSPSSLEKISHSEDNC